MSKWANYFRGINDALAIAGPNYLAVSAAGGGGGDVYAAVALTFKEKNQQQGGSEARQEVIMKL